jgi:hypothetical protein
MLLRAIGHPALVQIHIEGPLTDFPLEFGRSFSSILWQISSLPSCKPDAIPVYIPP